MKTCLCCGYKTLEDESAYDICPICFWEDDPIHYGDADCTGGANGNVSLREAQKNYMLFGACDKASVGSVRKVNTFDEKDTLWCPYEDVAGNTVSVDINLDCNMKSEEILLLLKERLGFSQVDRIEWDTLRDLFLGDVDLPEKITFIGWIEFEMRFPKESLILKQILNKLGNGYGQSCIVSYLEI